MTRNAMDTKQQEPIVKIYFTRHGDKKGDDLSPLGIKQAQKRGSIIEQHRETANAEITNVFSAHKPRVQNTARYIKEQVAGGKELPIQVKDFLGDAGISKEINDEIGERMKTEPQDKVVRDFLEGKFNTGTPRDVALPIFKKIIQYMKFLGSGRHVFIKPERALMANQQMVVESLMLELFGENSAKAKIFHKPLGFAEGGSLIFSKDVNGKITMRVKFRGVEKEFTQEEVKGIYTELKNNIYNI